MKAVRTAASQALAALTLLASAGPGLAEDPQDLAGAALRVRPLHEGSDHRTTDVVPLLQFRTGPWFARSTQGILEGGARFAVTEGLEAGAQLAHQPGPQDGDAGISAGVHLEWSSRIGPAPLTALARARRHLDTQRGFEGDARLTLGVLDAAGFRAGLFGQATFANENNLQSYYGATAGGLSFTSAGALGSYRLSPRLLATASFESRRLGSDAARGSFVTEARGTYASIGVMLHF